MTLRALDSIYVANLPPGADCYIGYTDGAWVTAPLLVKRFPGAQILTLTVTASRPDADGCDCETLDLTDAQAVAWARDRVGEGRFRPVVYASVDRMDNIVAGLEHDGVTRPQVRLLSAHYGTGEHICGPDTCKATAWAMDGTQWTTTAPGENGSRIDQSALLDNFLAAPAARNPQEDTGMLLLAPGKYPLAIPAGTTRLHFVALDHRKVTIVWQHGATNTTEELSWDRGSAWPEVPKGVFAAEVEVSGLTGHVALAFS